MKMLRAEGSGNYNSGSPSEYLFHSVKGRKIREEAAAVSENGH